MAVGGKRSQIFLGFLCEAGVLGVCGALSGILVGIWACGLVGSYFGWPIYTPLIETLGVVAMLFFLSTIVGIYPAWRAARLNPIDALRYEH